MHLTKQKSRIVNRKSLSNNRIVRGPSKLML